MSIRGFFALFIIGVLLQGGGCMFNFSWLRGAAQSGVPLSGDVLFDFSESGAFTSWFPVNDDVMGGVSQGGLLPSEDGTAIFTGEISFANNGGFSTVQSNFRPPLDLSSHTGLHLRVRGDGKQYAMYLRDGTRNLVHQAAFITIAGEWIDVQLPFTAFQPTFFGQPTRANPLDPARLTAISLLIEFKQEGPFALEIARISTYDAPR